MTKSPLASLPRAITLAVCLLALFLVRCGEDSSPPPSTPVPCGAVSDCRTSPDIPRCADLLTPSPKCIDGQCVYRLKITQSGCVCIEGDIRICALADTSGDNGVSVCENTPGSSTATRWADCVALNTP